MQVISLAVSIIVASLLVLHSPAKAQVSCGEQPKDVPPDIQQQISGDISGKAQLFSKLLGDSNLAGKVNASRNEIYQKHNNVDKSEIDRFMVWVSCQEIFSNKDLSGPQRLRLWREIYRELKLSPTGKLDEPEPDPRSVISLTLEYDALIGKRKYIDAIPLIERAAALGSVDAQLVLGVMYTSGIEGVPSNPVRAFNMFKTAAAAGNTAAIGRLGNAYLNGEGTKQNIPEAIWYTKIGVSRNDPYSLNTMGIFYQNGVGNFPMDQCRAFDFFKKSADLKSGPGEISLALMYANGSCVAKDMRRAYEILSPAADAGNPVAILGIKLMHEKHPEIFFNK